MLLGTGGTVEWFDCWTASTFEVKTEPPLQLRSRATFLRHSAHDEVGPTGHAAARALGKVEFVLRTLIRPGVALFSVHLIMATFNLGPGCAMAFAAGSAIRTASNTSRLFRIVKPSLGYGCVHTESRAACPWQSADRAQAVPGGLLWASPGLEPV